MHNGDVDASVDGREAPTAGWSDAGQVDWYLNRIGRLSPRIAGEDLLQSVLPAEPRSFPIQMATPGMDTAFRVESTAALTL
jgi:hypothetical protein